MLDLHCKTGDGDWARTLFDNFESTHWAEVEELVETCTARQVIRLPTLFAHVVNYEVDLTATCKL